MDDTLAGQIDERLRPAQRVLVVSHIRPDGDAIGSLLGWGLAVQAAGKDVTMVSEDGVPASLRHLAGSEQVLNSAKGDFDLICVVDCSDLERTGKVLAERGVPHLNIDHHPTNLNFAAINVVDVEAVATAEMIADLLPALGLPLTTAVAEALLTGLITDTLGFRTSNMSSKSMRLAADLMDRGANLPELYRRALVDRSYESIRLWGSGLTRTERDGRLLYTTLTLADRQAVGYPGRDDADLINILSAVSGVDIALIFVEQPNGRVKVSWRSAPGYDVSKIAVRFGGGGHAAASGADIPGSLEEVQQTVLDATRPILNGGTHVQSF